MNKLRLALAPTPLQRLNKLGAFLGIDLWIKRDDLTGDILTGGNKIRKLEYLLFDAKKQGADTVLVTGGLQSNLVKTAAALAIKQEMRPVLVLLGSKPQQMRGNLFLDSLLNVDFKFIEADHPDILEAEMIKISLELKQEGKVPYIIPFGASNGLGALGYVDGYKELEVQRKALNIKFAWEFVSTGSGGTFAGIFAGHQLCCSDSSLVGISPWLSREEVSQRIKECIRQLAVLLETDFNCPAFMIEDCFIGEGYGIPSKQGIEAIKLLAEKEAVLLDHTYTGKAMAGLLHYVRSGKVKQGESVLFWHTGGTAALSLLEEQWGMLDTEQPISFSKPV